jgi:uncharacterized protein (TIGR02145 family)
MVKSLAIVYWMLASTMISHSQKTTLVDERDGKTYKVVQIGSQIWMAENLAYAPNIVSTKDVVSHVKEIFDTKPEDGRDAKYDEFEKVYDKLIFCYHDFDDYCRRYGALYTWEAALNSCPNGWHLPTKMEYDTLLSSFGRSRKDQYEAIAQGGSSGFDCIAAGILLGFDTLIPGFEGENRWGFYWTSTASPGPGKVKKIERMIFSKMLKKVIVNANKDRFQAAFSVRCIKDYPQRKAY